MSQSQNALFRAALAGLLFFLTFTGITLSSHAGEGVFLLGNDALQLGRASSGVASPRSAYWSYMNPASMVDLERRLDVNWYSVLATSRMTARGFTCSSASPLIRLICSISGGSTGVPCQPRKCRISRMGICDSVTCTAFTPPSQV